MSHPNTLAARTRRSLMALAVAAVLLVISAFSAHAQTVAAAKIAFDRGGKIWTMDPDGGQQARVSNTFGISPSLSADGKRVAFLCGAEPLDVCAMNVDGTGVRRLTDTQDNFNPAWSPDATRIVFTSHREGDYHVYTMNADGSNVRRLVSDHGDIYAEDYAAWSPDGKRIAFVGRAEDGYNIYLASVKDGEVVELLADEFIKENLAWSPDGKQLAFDTIDNVYTIGADGGGLRQLTQGAGENTTPTWSPDGAQIAFHRTKVIRDEFGRAVSREGGIYVMTAGGGNLTRLDVPESFSPSWRVVPAQDAKPVQALAERAANLAK
jgi:Tol biopolymer transport system component